ncbi:MAG: VWA domain-containing protein [Deltaproteobacteria bacterium]|nr:VWA domain-containing protein [Myxococcales bacterium]MDP3213685.1 VWA domain-containing protein [Deltaproteobacteria bacterium]
MKLRGRPAPVQRVIPRHRSPAGPVAWMAALIVALVLGGLYGYARFQGWDLQLKFPWALLSLPGALLIYVCSRLLWRRAGAVPGEALTRLKVSQGAALRGVPRTLSARLIHLPGALRVAAIVLVGVALARPQRVDAPDALELSGIDIVMSIDLSGSMRAADLQPTRLEAAKEVVGEFIQRRRSDRMGLVVFGREAFTVVPPTLDYTVLQRMVSALSLDLIDGSGTAIGDGLGTALNRLRHSDARSKVVVLLTDGANNAGHVDPREAAQLATALRVKVYTILVGTAEEAPVQQGVDLAGRPVYATARFPVDPQLLQDIATTTGGQFFRAVDRAGLAQSFHTILDHLERSKIADAGARYAELYSWLVVAALALLALEVLLSSTRLRRFP